MRYGLAAGAVLLALSGCATTAVQDRAAAPIDVKIIALNDFHGALEPPGIAIPATAPDGGAVRVPAGGAAYLASAVQGLKAANPNHAVVSAGDLISASPLISSYFLDEPTIHAMNMIGLDFNAVGNHEFDRGRAELLRMQHGGCDKNTALQPCAVDPDFPGARFKFLAANVKTENGGTLFPSYGIRSYGKGKGGVQIGFIGLTLKETPTLVTPAGVAGLSFADEADSINALIPKLRSEGADAIVVLIHQGVSTKVGYNDKSCGGMDGDLMPILARLDPQVDLVVSGHTHNAYICDYGRIDPARPFLVTSAGRSGTLLTDITLSIDPSQGDVVARRADNMIVQGEGYQSASGAVAATGLYPRFPREPRVAALVDRYAAAVAPVAQRKVGTLAGPALRQANEAGESVLGALIADAHLAATSAPENGGAQIAFSNAGSLRADIVPAEDGSVTYGQLFAAQPFGNTLFVKSFTGRQIRALLEQQFNSGTNTAERPNMLLPSRGFTYGYDLSQPAGQRIIDIRLNGAPLDDAVVYRVAMNSFLATGGDNFTIFRDGGDPVGGPIDVDALERYIVASGRLAPPAANRITRITPPWSGAEKPVRR
ncbi:bifunctional metallophosphatase/5'-nucleotidase [Allosphingosinicella flava]|uniref:Bifunctional metallophosphatase/5'-nucleotidase n=1 Tax=Allosphingosinicella flava TaxID=2771430 RepID=A0A7T2LMU6_9SPHN|nr:bifunctional metallophosphatase/5'-nucleotidase [Sphingosinicella flava]QPQ55916.1 bifunctional metallophosphatase/5'-nucleotidase [Sphingosinicella flava]